MNGVSYLNSKHGIENFKNVFDIVAKSEVGTGLAKFWA